MANKEKKIIVHPTKDKKGQRAGKVTINYIKKNNIKSIVLSKRSSSIC